MRRHELSIIDASTVRALRLVRTPDRGLRSSGCAGGEAVSAAARLRRRSVDPDARPSVRDHAGSAVASVYLRLRTLVGSETRVGLAARATGLRLSPAARPAWKIGAIMELSARRSVGVLAERKPATTGRRVSDAGGVFTRLSRRGVSHTPGFAPVAGTARAGASASRVIEHRECHSRRASAPCGRSRAEVMESVVLRPEERCRSFRQRDNRRRPGVH